jgi:hypothetical protein
MLVKMGQSFFAGTLVRRTDAGPDLDFHDGRAVALAKEKGQSVRQDTMSRFGGGFQSRARVQEALSSRPENPCDELVSQDE